MLVFEWKRELITHKYSVQTAQAILQKDIDRLSEKDKWYNDDIINFIISLACSPKSKVQVWSTHVLPAIINAEDSKKLRILSKNL